MIVAVDLLCREPTAFFHLIHHPDEPGRGLRRDAWSLAHHPREADGVLSGINQQAAGSAVAGKFYVSGLPNADWQTVVQCTLRELKSNPSCGV
jgi:hypothetical protein